MRINLWIYFKINIINTYAGNNQQIYYDGLLNTDYFINSKDAYLKKCYCSID